MYELHSAIILQPGPAALTDGVAQINAIFDRWEQRRSTESKTQHNRNSEHERLP
jgi:iron complex transport system substrate-binding protein